MVGAWPRGVNAAKGLSGRGTCPRGTWRVWGSGGAHGEGKRGAGTWHGNVERWEACRGRGWKSVKRGGAQQKGGRAPPQRRRRRLGWDGGMAVGMRKRRKPRRCGRASCQNRERAAGRARSRAARSKSSTQRLGTYKREQKRGGRASDRRAARSSGTIDRRRLGWAGMGSLARRGLAMLGWCMFADAREPRQSAKVQCFRVLTCWEGRAIGSWHPWERVRTQRGWVCAQRRRSRTVICA